MPGSLARLLLAGLLLGGPAACGGTTDAPATPRSGSPSSIPTPSPTPPAARAFTLVATGDVLLHEPLWEQAQRDAVDGGYDFRPLLAGLVSLVEPADLAVCHLETPIGPTGGPYEGFPTFSVPAQIAPALADTGYDVCTTASNHTLDQGDEGIRHTLDALDEAGIEHTGSARTRGEAARPLIVRAGGANIAVLSYSYGFNGRNVPADRPWAANQIDQGRILAEARQARAAGADVVMVSLHWGTEYQQTPNAQQRRLAPRLLDSRDIDLLIGHHAHAVQPIERIEGEWVAYGLGNSVAAHATNRRENREGLVVRFRFSEGADGRWAVTAAEYAPTWMTERPYRIVDLGRTLAAGRLPAAVRESYQATFDRIVAVAERRNPAELRPVIEPPVRAAP